MGERDISDKRPDLKDKATWRDPSAIASFYGRDPNCPNFQNELAQFNETVVKPAKITNFLDTLFRRRHNAGERLFYMERANDKQT